MDIAFISEMIYSYENGGASREEAEQAIREHVLKAEVSA